MSAKMIIQGTLAYTLVTFPFAIFWHIVLFEELYKAFNYFEGEPSFALGFLSIFVQGLVLSTLYSIIRVNGHSLGQALKYSLLMGLFLWSTHVIAFVAKQTIPNVGMFIALESLYLLLQFLLYGLCISWIFRHQDKGKLNERH